MDARRGAGDVPAEGLQAQFVQGLLADQQEPGRAVVHRGCVARRDRAPGPEDGLEAGQFLQRGVLADALVLPDHDAVGGLHGQEFVVEVAVLACRGGPLVAAQRERVLPVPGDAVPLGDLLGRLAHGQQAVQVLHGRVDQAPAEAGVVGLDAVRQGLVGAGQHEGGAAHRLGAAREHDVGLARGDGARGGGDRFEAGGAQPVDGGARDGLGQAGQQRGHARDVAVVLAGLVGGAPVDVVDAGRVQGGHVGHQVADHGRRQIVGPQGGQGSAELADGGAAGGREVDGTHGLDS